MTTVESIVRAGGYNSPDYWRAVRQGKPAESRTDPSVNYPAPEHTTNDPWPPGWDLPSAPAKYKRTAESAGWAVRVGYSRGRYPDQYGRPGIPMEWASVQCFHPDTRCRVVMLYSVTGKAWKSVTLATKGGITVDATATDALEFLQLAGRIAADPRRWTMLRRQGRKRVRDAR